MSGYHNPDVVLYEADESGKMFTHSGIIVWVGDKVVLVYGNQYKKWSIPKGHVDEGETVRQCAVREVKEETGLAVTLPPKTAFIKIHNHCYFMHYMHSIPELKQLNDDEIGNIKMFTIDEIAKLPSDMTNGALKIFVKQYQNNTMVIYRSNEISKSIGKLKTRRIDRSWRKKDD